MQSLKNAFRLLKDTFPAIKALFVNRKVRKFVGLMLFIALVIGFFASIALDVAIPKMAEVVTNAYQPFN